MKHLRVVSKAPKHAEDIPTDVIIDFILALLAAIKPILIAKEGVTTTT